MAVLCTRTLLGEFYLITDSKIVCLLRNYIGYSGESLRKKAEQELSAATLKEQFKVFKKDVKRVLYDNFKVKKKIVDYDDKCLAIEVIKYSGEDEDNYFRNAIIIILKVLEYVEKEIEKYDDKSIEREVFRGEASYLHLLLSHIEEFVSEVASKKENKQYGGSFSRKKLLACEVFDLARRIPKGLAYTNEVTHMYEVIFFIRQAIELKVLEALSIKGVVNKKYHRPVKISADAFINLLADPAVKQYAADRQCRQIDVKFINTVHTWTNYFVHSGTGYWFWEIEFVRIILQEFILDPIEIDEEYLKMIPAKILECVKEDERMDVKVLMECV